MATSQSADTDEAFKRSLGLGRHHHDIVHDVAFDFYGKRLATVGADHCLHVWNQSADKRWKIAGSIKSHHSGSVPRVTWSHPEYGQVIATCSYDGTVRIWQEGVPSSTDTKAAATWDRKYELVYGHAVTDVRFAPRHCDYGLAIATCTRSGQVEVKEAEDVIKLDSWSSKVQFKVKALGAEAYCTSVDWSQSKRHPQVLAVGCNKTSGAGLHIYKITDKKNPTAIYTGSGQVLDVRFAPGLGRSFSYLAAGGDGVAIYRLSHDRAKPDAFIVEAQPLKGAQHSATVCRVSWNMTGTTLATSDVSGRVLLWSWQDESWCGEAI